MFAFLPVTVKLYLYALSFLLGSFLGSGLHCLAYRLVRGQRWSKGRSLCPHCGHMLGIGELIPIGSFLFLKGRCRHCGEKIPVRYLLAELALGICFLSLLWKFGLTMDFVSAGILCCCLLCLSLVDLESLMIPDRFLMLPALIRSGQLLYQGRLLSGMFPALIFGFGLLLLSLLMDQLLQTESLGGGDIKLVALFGLYFSIGECLFLLIVACVLGLTHGLLRRRPADTPFPFGPYLSFAGWLTLLFGSEIVHWYLRLFSL